MFSPVINLDALVEQYFFAIHNSSAETLFAYLTKLGGVLAATIIFLATAYFLWKRERGLLKPFALFFLANEALVFVFKNLVGRLRPFGAIKYGEFDGSFPSGHAAASIFLYGFVFYLVHKFYSKERWANGAYFFLAILIFLIGFSRLYLDIHYLSDVLAGYFLGGFLLLALIRRTKNHF